MRATPWAPQEGDLFIHLRPKRGWSLWAVTGPVSPPALSPHRWPKKQHGWGGRNVEHLGDYGYARYGGDFWPRDEREHIGPWREGTACMGLVPMFVPAPEEWEAIYRMAGAEALLAKIAQENAA